MNKKFSTLVASVLLAGGLATPAFADTFSKVAGELEVGEVTNQYYHLYVHDKKEIKDDFSGANVLLPNGSNASVADAKENGYWRVKKVSLGNGKVGYQLINIAGEVLAVKENNVTYNVFSGDDVALWFESGKGFYGSMENVTANPGFDQPNTVYRYNLQAVASKIMSAEELKKNLGYGFGIQICKHLEKADGSFDLTKAPVEYTNLEGNVFTSVLFAKEGSIERNGTKAVKLYQGSEKGKQIVLTTETWGTQAGGTTQQGFKFAAVTNKEYAALKKDNKIKAEEFVITAPSTVTGEPLEVVAVWKENSVVKGLELVASNAYADHFTLTVSEELTVGYADYTYENDVNGVKNNTWVKFGLSNLIDYTQFLDKVVNITRTPVEGGAVESAAVDCDAKWAPVAKIALDQPEGQWLLSSTEGQFTNRESGNTVELYSLRKTDAEGVYTDGEYNYTIKAVATPGFSEDGYYSVYSADQLKQKAFFIGTPIASTGETVYMTNKDGKIAWTLEKTDAIEFRFSKVIFGDSKTDNIHHYTTYLGLNKKDQLVEKVDTLNFYRYNLAEVATGKTLGYDSNNKVFTLADAKEEENNTAWNEYTVVLKNKSAELYNLVTEVDGDVLTYVAKDGDTGFGKATENQWMTAQNAFCSVKKLYGAHNSNSLVQAQDAYTFVENDLFVIEDADANMYRPVATMDTIKIFRNVDNNYVMYETGKLLADAKGDAIEGFLGIQNFLDPKFAEKNPAMLADTAAGQGTWRPEYMLAVDANIVPAGKYCPIHGLNSGCKDEHLEDVPGYVEGRYLVNLVDSAKAGRKDCMFQELNGTKYYRLGFVQAKHLGDSLIINAVAPAKADTINLLDNTLDKVCSFAFRYVDATRDAFRIETAYEVNRDKDGDVESTRRGYIKYHNGIPVVTSNVSDAEVFDLEVLHNQAPTSNEEVAVSEVSVVAVDGAVVVKGAAGKTVAISNILGQTIANTVIASDNETIAVPAGIVVVAVEGEEAVKAIVR